MKHIIKLALVPLALIGVCAAQTVTVYPAASSASRGSYQTITAKIVGSGAHTVTWTTTGGTLVGSNPCTSNDDCTIALYSLTPGTYTVTAMQTGGSAAASIPVTITASPTPEAGHPRLFINSGNLAAIRAKATLGNPMFVAERNYAIDAYNSANPNWSWTCNSGTGTPSVVTDYSLAALKFSFMALMHPTEQYPLASGCTWLSYAHDIWMWQVNTNQVPVGDDSIRYLNRQLTLTPDWLMGAGGLNSTEWAQSAVYAKSIIKAVLDMGIGGQPPATFASGAADPKYNAPAQFQFGLEGTGNNYYEGKFPYVAMLAATFGDDATADPTVSNCSGGRYSLCSDYSANSLWAYWDYFVGGWMYAQWAHLDDPNVTWQAYQAKYANVPTQPMYTELYTTPTSVPAFGTGRGGGATEGNGYGYSQYSVRMALVAIHTAGLDDPLLYGPQMSLVNSSYWPLLDNAELTYLAGPYSSGGFNPYAFFTTGDTNNYNRTPTAYQTIYDNMILNSANGYSISPETWLMLNTAVHGLSNFMTYDMTNDFMRNSSEEVFIALPAGDPTVSPPADPRPSLPVENYVAGLQDLFSRTGWNTSTDTTVASYWHNSLIDHTAKLAGRFDVFSNGEYITKGRMVFDDDYNYDMTASQQSNLVSIKNNPSATCVPGTFFMDQGCVFGGEWGQTTQQSLVTPLHSELPSYTAWTVDLKGQYNTNINVNPTNYGPFTSGVSAASRDFLWVKGTVILYYDRAATNSNAWDKSTWFVTTGAPTISGNTTTWLTRSTTQKASMTTVLPASPTITNAGLLAGGPAQSNDWEPFTQINVDAGNVAATQFLNVLQWGASGFTPATVTLVQSTSGQAFDGALFGENLALFMRTPTTFTSTAFPASSATLIYVSDLAPNTSYLITGAGTPGSATSDTAGVLVFPATGTGNITVGAGSPPSGGVTISGGVVLSGSVVLQ